MDHIFYKKCFFLRLLVLRDSSTHPILVISPPWLSTDLFSQSSWSESDRQKASYPPQYALREKNSAVLQQPLYKPLTQRLCSVIEAAISPWRLTRSPPAPPPYPAGTNYLALMRARLSFLLTARSRDDFSLLLFGLVAHRRIWTLHRCGFVCVLVTFSRSYAATPHRESGRLRPPNIRWNHFGVF